MTKKKMKLLDSFSKCKSLLPDEFLPLIDLYLLQNKTQKEVAEILNLSTSVVRSKINQAAFLMDKTVKSPEYLKALKIQTSN